MKRLVFVTLTAFISFCYAEAQIEMNSSGDVGIGRSPYLTYKLSVQGDMYIYPDGSDEQFIITETSDEPVLKPSDSSEGRLGSSTDYFNYTYTRYIYRTTEVYLSDKRVKTNIREIENPLTTITNLNGIRFDFTEEAFPNEKPERRQELLDAGKDSYGFLAQDVQQVIPQAVTYDSIDDLYYMSNDAIIPLLVEAMKEQQQSIEELRNELAVLSKSSKSSSSISTSSNDFNMDLGATKLFQNSPNPFTEETKIKYYLEDNVNTATMYIYDMSGKQLKSYELHPRDEGNIIISGGELDAGMYMYTMIADGAVIGSKQMILTD